jgi:homogentisate phytyltransferase/homogentisate geranylgeranyltransferase
VSSIAAAAPVRPGVLLWRFGRPHTLVGTALSVLGIYAIAAHVREPVPAWDLAATLVAALAVNVFITGINQLEDVEIDRINKPRLPLAAGDLSMRSGRTIVAVAGALPVAMALTQGWIELVAVLVALGIGWAYSCEPLRLKRFPVAASASISIVRSVVVNLGVCLHFTAGGSVPAAVWALTVFVLPFSFAIAVLKDVPDAEGDSAFDVRTFTVRLGQRTAMALGMAALTLAYAGMAVAGPLWLDDAQPVVLVVAHVVALAVVWAWAVRVDPTDREDFTAFYMRVWGLFFCEYLVVPAAVLLS